MVTHRLSLFSYIISFFLFFFFTGQLHVLASHDFFLPANSMCWPITLQPDGSHRLSLLAFPHAREILLEMLTIDSNRKLDAVQFLEHVCIPRQKT